MKSVFIIACSLFLSLPALALLPKPGKYKNCGLVSIEINGREGRVVFYVPSGEDRPKNWRIVLTSKNPDGSYAPETANVFKSFERTHERLETASGFRMCLEGYLYYEFQTPLLAPTVSREPQT